MLSLSSLGRDWRRLYSAAHSVNTPAEAEPAAAEQVENWKISLILELFSFDIDTAVNTQYQTFGESVYNPVLLAETT